MCIRDRRRPGAAQRGAPGSGRPRRDPADRAVAGEGGGDAVPGRQADPAREVLPRAAAPDVRARRGPPVRAALPPPASQKGADRMSEPSKDEQAGEARRRRWFVILAIITLIGFALFTGVITVC